MTQADAPESISIGQVVSMLAAEFPDISVSSLRFLEREGLLNPLRPKGGHRRYRLEDVERIRTIKQWQAKRISLKEIRHRLESAIQIKSLPNSVEQMTGLLMAEDIEGAVAVLEDLNEAGTSLLHLCDDVITPVLRNLGDDEGNHLVPVDVQMELDQRLVRFLSSATVVPDTIGTPVVVAACPLWERHDLPLQMLGALLMERGASVHFIGAMVDSEFLIDANARIEPDFIIVSMSIAPDTRVSDQWFTEVISSIGPTQHLVIGGKGAQTVAHLAVDNVMVAGDETYTGIVARLLHARKK